MLTMDDAINAIEQTSVVIASVASATKGSVQLRMELIGLRYSGMLEPYYWVFVDGDDGHRFENLEAALVDYNREAALRD